MSATHHSVLEHVLDVLNAMGIQYMLVGSVASAYWGRPRTIDGADVAVASCLVAGEALATALGAQFCAPEPIARGGAGRSDQVGAIHIDTGFEVDLWSLTDSAFDLERFGRRRGQGLFGRTVWLSTAEDVILGKLLWRSRAGDENRQYLDALEVYEVQKPQLDEAYLDDWAERLGLTDLLQRIRTEAAEPQ